jgi:hypothetical protein
MYGSVIRTKFQVCKLQLKLLSLSIDITEEGSDVGDDSDDEDFESSPNFTLRFVMLISYVSVVTYILLIDPSEAYDQISDCCHK